MNAIKATAILFTAITVVSAWAGPAEDQALRDAAVNLDLEGVKASLAKGANPNAASSDKHPLTPIGALGLGQTAREDQREVALKIAKALFDAGARFGPLDRQNFFFFIAQGNAPLVALLLDKGASPTAWLEGYTPAQLALKFGHPEVYQLLVSRGAVPVNESTSAQLALVEAAVSGDIQKMNDALRHGARVNDADTQGGTALLSAVRAGIYTEKAAIAVRWLLDHGADPNKKGESGFTDLEGIPLHVFVFMNTHTMKPDPRRPQMSKMAEETMVYLLKAGAKVSAMDSLGRTPLHQAAMSNNLRGAEILIQNGARIMARDAKNRTPLDYAESGEMIKLLKSHGAREF